MTKWAIFENSKISLFWSSFHITLCARLLTLVNQTCCWPSSISLTIFSRNVRVTCETRSSIFVTCWTTTTWAMHGKWPRTVMWCCAWVLLYKWLQLPTLCKQWIQRTSWSYVTGTTGSYRSAVSENLPVDTMIP